MVYCSLIQNLPMLIVIGDNDLGTANHLATGIRTLE